LCLRNPIRLYGYYIAYVNLPFYFLLNYFLTPALKKGLFVNQ